MGKTHMKTTVDKGSAHAIIIVVLVVALLGTLGFVFYQNFIKKDDTAKTSDIGKQTSDETAKPADVYAGWQTYTSKQHGISFRYPADWKVASTEATTEGNYELNAVLTNGKNQSEQLAVIVNPQGLGGAGISHPYKVLHSEKITLPTKADSYITYIVEQDAFDDAGKLTGKYTVKYGITDDPAYYTEGKTGTTGGNAESEIIYLIAAPKQASNLSTLYVEGRYRDGESIGSFEDHAAAEAYYQSSEYQQILNTPRSIKIAG